MVRSHHQSPPPRPGVILLVTVIMLALLAVIGLSFVLYAESEATASRIYRVAQSPPDPPLPSELLLAWALGQLIYDCSDSLGAPMTGFDVTSALRGHSLARTAYGWNTGTNPVPTNDRNNNIVAFNGRGAKG